MLNKHIALLTIATAGILLAGTMGGCPFFDNLFPSGDPNTTDPNTTDPNTTGSKYN